TTKRTIELSNKLIPFHSKRLDSIQSMYLTKESFDDFYYGKGSTFSDVHGSVGILFEQASSRALYRNTNQGRLTYAFSIRNHYMSTLGTLDGLVALRNEFLEYHRNFYATSSIEAKKNPVKGYLISLKDNRTRAQMLIQNLQKHRIIAHSLKKPITVKQNKFNPSEAIIIPSDQPQTRFLKGIMEKVIKFEDSLFYDVSAWTLPYAYGVKSFELKQNPKTHMGPKLDKIVLNGGEVIGGRARSAYIMKWNRYYAPKSLYKILDSGINPRLANAPFSAMINGKEVEFERGSIIIPVNQRDADSKITQREIYQMMTDLSKSDHVQIYASNSAATSSGSFLGGASHSVLEKPKVAILSGPGSSSYGVGEIWHVTNFRMKMPSSLIDADNLNKSKLANYNTIIIPDGYYQELEETDIENLKDWVLKGGTLIGTQTGSQWIINKTIINEKIKKTENMKLDIAYDQLRNVSGAQRIGGAIFEVELDNTHPIAYGYNNKTSLFRRGTHFFELSEGPSANVGRYSNNPLVSGYISEEKEAEIKNSASIIARRQGQGHIVLFADNPSFRAFWYGTDGLLLNAIFFGQTF
ncbi:MAG: peptidase M14, partial [Candidatus Marinimicrobia bacterium]|nr:peptidase M14 [Candidatus Neomarinimicrobiota bacterium]